MRVVSRSEKVFDEGGGASIHSSRLGASSSAEGGREGPIWRRVEAVGREGPKASSSDESEESESGLAVVGWGGGGRGAGPVFSESESESSRVISSVLLLARWGGRVGPTAFGGGAVVAMVG